MNSFKYTTYDNQINILLICTVISVVIWGVIIYKTSKIKLPK